MKLIEIERGNVYMMEAAKSSSRRKIIITNAESIWIIASVFAPSFFAASNNCASQQILTLARTARVQESSSFGVFSQYGSANPKRDGKRQRK